MIELKGKYSSAKIFAEKVEEGVISQVYELLNHPMFKDEKIRIQADTHQGSGCVIGLTATTKDIIIPNIIGVDIGCGMLSICLGDIDIELKELDEYIHNSIPSGFNINSKKAKEDIDKDFLKEVEIISKKTNTEYQRHVASLGSLGGGNHFLEVSKDKDNNKWLIIHSGSRNFGYRVAHYHQKIAEDYCKKERNRLNDVKNKNIGFFKQKKEDFNSEFVKNYLKGIEKNLDSYKIKKELSFLEGHLANNYIKDMKIAQQFATINREIIGEKICNFLGLIYSDVGKFETIHNYYDGEIIRKGAISAKENEIVLIPINMRDGSILAKGKGNPDYNYSAPHGAGRLMSRSKAKENISFDEFKETMNGIYTTSVHNSTIDEAPQSYKTIKEILDNITDTVEVIDILKPIYNFKSH